MELVRTKLDAPSLLDDLVERPRLLQRLQDVSRMRLTVLQTPAGYGKTCLLSQWFHALQQDGRTVAWLAVDGFDRDPVGLLAYLATALSEAHVQLEPSIERLLGAELFSTPDSFLAALVNGMEKFHAPIYVFLDDVHLLGASTAAMLYRLIERAPRNAHFVVACRSVPDLNLARARARDQLLELSTDDLRFTLPEAGIFMTRCGHVTLGEGDLATLDERTEGWIAGIKLASLALRTGPNKDILTSFSGSRRAVSDFFAEEVLSSKSGKVRDFLLRTSVLGRFSPALCQAVTDQPDARCVLNGIEESGLFLLQLDDDRNWFRYHHLFADFLNRRLNDEHPGLEKDLHLRASNWFWNAGLYVEAIDHALQGGEPERAAQLLELRCHDMTFTGKFQLVRKFTAQIPEQILYRYPRVLLTMAWLLTRNLRFEESRVLLDKVRERLQQMQSQGELAAEEIRKLSYLVLHREMVLAAAEDDPLKVEQLCQRLMAEFPEERHPYLTGTIYTQLLYARREQYLLADLERLQAQAQGTIGRSEFTFATIALQASIGPTLFFAGRADAARRALEQGLEEATRYGGRNSALAALPALPLSEILYESNDLDRAEELIEQTLPFAAEFGFVDQLMPGYITQSRIRRARDDVTGAFRSLDEAMTVAIERRLDRLRYAVVAERVRLLIQDGRLELARQCAAEAGIPEPGEPILPRGDVTTTLESKAIAWVRLAQCEDRLPDALSAVKHWRNFCVTRGAIRSLVRWNILLAQILYVGGDLRTAQRALRDAISHAAGIRLVRSFLDEGRSIQSLLTATYDSALEVLHPTDAFASELLDAFSHAGHRPGAANSVSRPAAAEGLYGKLSSKEREILALVSSGMRNREVAKKLGMTEGSVKWYMQQVYDKVGTRRRLQAVERARQFGLIA